MMNDPNGNGGISISNIPTILSVIITIIIYGINFIEINNVC